MPASRRFVSKTAHAPLPLHSRAITFLHIHRRACQACKQAACLLGCSCFSSFAFTRKYLLTHSQEGLSSLQAGGVSPGLLVLFFLCIHAQLPSHTLTGGPVKPASRQRVSWAACAFLPLHSHASTFSHIHRRACQACKQAACLLGCSCFSSSAFTRNYLLTHSQEGLSSLQAGSMSPGLLVLSLPLHLHASTFSHIHRRACQACKQAACLLGCSCFSSSAFRRIYLLTHSQEGLSSLQAGGVSPGLLVLFFLCINAQVPSHTLTRGPVKPASRRRVPKAARAFLPLHSRATTFSHIHRRACQACKQVACLLGCSCYSSSAFTRNYLLTHSQEGLSSLQAGSMSLRLLVLLFLCIHAQLPSHTFTGGPVKPASRQRVSWAACAFLPLHSHASTFSHIHRRACQACKQVACLLGCSCYSSSAFTRNYLLTHSQEGLSSLQAGSMSLRLLVLLFLCIYTHLPSHTFTGGPVKPASRQRVSWAARAFSSSAFTHNYLLTHSQEGLSSLQAGGVSPGLLIIDDGWQVHKAQLQIRPNSSF